jgi:hypothetical protein
MHELMKVSHDTIKTELKKEKEIKEAKKRAAKKKISRESQE